MNLPFNPIYIDICGGRGYNLIIEYLYALTGRVSVRGDSERDGVAVSVLSKRAVKDIPEHPPRGALQR